MTRFFPTVATASILFWATSLFAQALSVDGAWQLESYRLQGQDVPVSGVMIFADGHFGMVYSMEYQGRSARGHGGTYRLEGDAVTFVIPWWVEHVAGEARVMTEEIEASGRIELFGDQLTLNLASGSQQRFRRIAVDQADELSGSWLMESYTSRAKTGPTSGMAAFADDHFILLYTMRPDEASLDGRAHAGRYEKDGSSVDLHVAWSLQMVGGVGSVDEDASQRATTVEVSDDRLRLDLGGGAVQTFRRTESSNE